MGTELVPVKLDLSNLPATSPALTRGRRVNDSGYISLVPGNAPVSKTGKPRASRVRLPDALERRILFSSQLR
jgi:hypothetical protein